MSFQFPLATLLRVRTLREEREERMLQQILGEIVQTTRLLDEIDTALQQVNASRSTHMQNALTGSDVHNHYGQLGGLRQNKAELRSHLDKLEDLKDKQLRVYDAARQNREMLTDLDDNQRAGYYAEIAKREQKTIDDTFAARRRRA